MAGKRWFAVFFGLSLCTSALAQSWDRYETKDEMRGTATPGAAMTASASGDNEISLTMRVMDMGEKSQGIVFSLKKGMAQCAEPICQIAVRFGDGAVEDESMSVAAAGDILIPTDSAAFAGAVSLSDKLFIELPMKDGTSRQFKYVLDGPAFPRVRYPEFQLAGVSLGDSASVLGEAYKPFKGQSFMDCRQAIGVSDAIKGATLPKVRMCFYRDMLDSVVIEVATPKDYAVVEKYVTAAFGRADPNGTYKSWPASTGKVIDLNTSSAAYWPTGKVKGAGLFIITDDSISKLTPAADK